MAGTFYVIDGPDGSGKTTQAARAAEYLRRRGAAVVVLREPGATPAGEAIRDLLLDADTDLTPLAEMLLYQAARAQLVETVIRPALEEGQTVVLDRYWYSTAAYQAYGLGLDPAVVRRVSAAATGGLEPDHVFLLDVDPETGLGRLDVGRDRIEGRPLDYHRRVREGFLAVARDLGERATVVDANGSADEVAAQILGVLERL
ncbi:MAG: dTMP kinase [Planctomycetota bacterium]